MHHHVDIDAHTRLYLGDARDILPGLALADLVLTDPPYGIGFANQPTNSQRANGMQPDAWDDSPPDDDLIDLTLNSGRVAIVWGGNYFMLPPSRCWLAWVKEGNAPSMADMELAWCNTDTNARVFRKTVKSASLEKDLQRWPHPSVKPVDLMQWCIEQGDRHYALGKWDNGTRKVRQVLDPFMGTGSTGVAAAIMGRGFVGIERDPRYFAFAVERIREAKKQADLFIDPPYRVSPSMTQAGLDLQVE